MITERPDISVVTPNHRPPQPFSVSAYIQALSARSKYAPFMYVNFDLLTRRFDVNGIALLDSGANICLVDVNILPDHIAKSLPPGDTNVQGVGGVSPILGQVIGTVTIGENEFTDVPC